MSGSAESMPSRRSPAPLTSGAGKDGGNGNPAGSPALSVHRPPPQPPAPHTGWKRLTDGDEADGHPFSLVSRIRGGPIGPSPPGHAADADPRGGQDRSLSSSPHGRTLMIVFPLRRSVGLKAATASSRVATLPMFVRSRPSRTRCTTSPSWARSDSTTKSTARPSVGRAPSCHSRGR
jgi:hypothetical protein